MAQVLIFAAGIDAEKRWMSAVFVWVLMSALCFLFVVQPKLLTLKKIQLDISVKEKQIDVEKAKLKDVTMLQEEVQKLQLKFAQRQQEKKQSEDILRSKLSSGVPELVDFFSMLARNAKQSGAKFVSIRPVEVSEKEGEKVLASAAGNQKAVEIYLVGKYSTIADILMKLEQISSLSSVKQFYMKEDKDGYPFLELKLTLGVTT